MNEINLPANADLVALALDAVRKAVHRGWTTAELAGCTRLAAAQQLGFVRRKRGKLPHYVATPAGRQALVAAAVLAAGFVAAGTTDTETVRIPTQASPVYGATGGALRTMGGRARYTKPGSDVRVTVGPQTTNVYRVVNGKTEFLANLNTRDIEPEQLTRDLLAAIVFKDPT